MKRVLLVMKKSQPQIENPIIESARRNNWHLEYAGSQIPQGWYGDGIIIDKLSQKELDALGTEIPIVTRTEIKGRNVRCLVGDTRKIAELTANYFIERGYVNFACFESYDYHNEYLEFPDHLPNPELALAAELEKHGHQLRIFYWHEQLPKSKRQNYKEITRVLGRFLKELPKPCAVFCPNLDYIYYFYRACENEKISVPHELAVLVINDEEQRTELTLPTTSAIAGETGDLGIQMAELLKRMMDGEEVSLRPLVVSPSHIVTRQSTDILAVPHLPTANAISFLLNNYRNQISVRDAAEYAGISLSSMKHMFRKYLDIGPGELLHKTRMNRIKELLIKTDKTLGEIAAETGYSSNMSLYLAFKKDNGMSPGEYRLARKA